MPVDPTPSDPRSWLFTTPQGLYCAPGDFHIDPARAVKRAVVTHGHGDHARSGHGATLATRETIEIMKVRFGEELGVTQSLRYGETARIGDVDVRLVPAGHILGSAQIVLEWQGSRIVVSGDFKRRRDPTCSAFEPVTCDVFITEATFALPVFRHPPDSHEIGRLLQSIKTFPERCHLVGVYALGKCQRVIRLLREAGYDKRVWLHGALVSLCDLYTREGVGLGDIAAVGEMGRNPRDDLFGRDAFKGAIVLCPPGALSDRWSRRFPDPLPVAASGWMRVRARARQHGAELPLVISDHADWDELCRTIRDVQAPRLWVTHGREDALVHQARSMGIEADALHVAGREEEGA
ncbi:MAG: ligase-associated DNA damage response exonuclease [Alphaproteobacteria bacterium]|nr:ligase-associated DNA damage response exonuclease [Alphaproteobacteria bacterium]MCW5739013.1 ligase-associated DNA damage response exonuclease [Alphaproteobacteria bacterium]